MSPIESGARSVELWKRPPKRRPCHVGNLAQKARCRSETTPGPATTVLRAARHQVDAAQRADDAARAGGERHVGRGREQGCRGQGLLDDRIHDVLRVMRDCLLLKDSRSRSRRFPDRRQDARRGGVRSLAHERGRPCGADEGMGRHDGGSTGAAGTRGGHHLHALHVVGAAIRRHQPCTRLGRERPHEQQGEQERDDRLHAGSLATWQCGPEGSAAC